MPRRYSKCGMNIYSLTISIRLFSWTYYFLDLANSNPLPNFSNVISLLLCSIKIFWISLDTVGCVLILISKLLCQLSTELFVLGKTCSTLSLTFHDSIENKGRRLRP